MSIPNEIRSALDGAGMKQVDLCRRVSITPKHLSQVLHGKAGVSVALLEEIARALNSEWLLIGEDGFIVDRIAEIRDAYTEAERDYNNPSDPAKMFLFGMRYVMRLLDMPEGKLPKE